MSFVSDFKPCYCDENCQEGFECDREHGVIYPQMVVPNDIADLFPVDASFNRWESGTVTVNWTIACDVLKICRYCKKEVDDEPHDG